MSGSSNKSNGEESWVLERLDDNGNVFCVARFDSEEAALAAAAAYEARGHKQSYSVRRIVLAERG